MTELDQQLQEAMLKRAEAKRDILLAQRDQLLAALKEIVEVLQQHDDWSAMDKAQAAIAAVEEST